MDRGVPTEAVLKEVREGDAPDSRLGVPGLVDAVRRGNVAVANPLGSSVLENPGLTCFLPRIACHFLGQGLDLPSVMSWWCEPGGRAMCSRASARVENRHRTGSRSQGLDELPHGTGGSL